MHHFDLFPSFAYAVKSGKLQNGRAIFQLLGDNGHAVVADIRTIDDKISILILDTLGIKDALTRYDSKFVSAMFGELPENVKLAVLAVDALKARNGCRIFALSAASKLAKESELFDEIHEANASDQVQVLKQINKNEIESRLSNTQLGNAPVDVYDNTICQNFRILNAHRLVPSSFQKHTQSKTSLKAWADEDKLVQIKVNKQGETLLSRFGRHIVERHKRDHYEENGKIQWSELKPIRFSASIEEKRLTYLDRAIKYLDSASKEEIYDLLFRFYKVQAEYGLSDLSEEDESKITSLEVGPQNRRNRPQLDLDSTE